MQASLIGKNNDQILAEKCVVSSNRLLRLPQIVGQKEITPEQAEVNRQTDKSPKNPRKYIEPLIPISRASWWAGIKSGKYPKPLKLGSRTTVWREADIIGLINPSDKTC